MLGDLFLEGLKSTNAEVSEVDLSEAHIEFCRGCFSCARLQNKSCIIKDDMAKVLEFFDSADALVCVSPVYFYSMSAQLKMFFDRCFPFVSGYDSHENQNGFERVNFAKQGKKFVAISTALGAFSDSFDALEQTYKAISSALCLEFCAHIRRAESPYFSEIGSDSLRIKKIKTAFCEAGKEFALKGSIEEKTKLQCELRLSQTDAEFLKRAKLYWKLLKSPKI